MYLKRIQLINFRKFATEDNIVEFVSSGIVQNDSCSKKEEVNEELTDANIVETEASLSDNALQIDVASDTTLIVGKNNAGKTTIIAALDRLINYSVNNAFGENDFNFRYLAQYLSDFDVDNPKSSLPYIEFAITIELEQDSSDRVSNLIPFMLVEDVEDSELDICIRYEVNEAVTFRLDMKELFKAEEEKTIFLRFLKLLHNTDFNLNYYDKNHNSIDKEFKISNLIELRSIKANHLKNEHCLTQAFNKIISYRYEHILKDGKKEIVDSLGTINNDLTENIRNNHTQIIHKALKEIMSMDRMGVQLSADITFEKLMRDLIKYEYIEDDVNIPEDQFGLGYTNLIMIIAALMDYMERYPDSSFNSKINLISIEEPETFMHPQMQELFIKNINEAIRVLLASKNKNVNSQIIITTHSAHILNSKIHSANTFNNICYLFEHKRNAAVVNLDNSVVSPNEGGEEDSAEFKFLKKHIKYKVSELFFSDAVIFVEGFAEDAILPFYIEQREGLSKHYISIFNINGAHGFLYKRLITALGIPVLIITDIDIQRENDEEDTETLKYPQIDCLAGKKTTNATIKNFYGNDDLSSIPDHIKKENIYVAYQGEINGFYATSFEEALILTNYNNEIVNELLSEIKPRIYSNITGNKKDFSKNIENSYKWQVKLEKEKGEFASRLLYKIVNEEDEARIPQIPSYISSGLDWIEEQLKSGGRK